jgi:hypothetical protein
MSPHIEGSDVTSIVPTNRVIRVGGIVRSPRQIIAICWEVDDHEGSGCTTCEAWRGQYVIDNLTRCGYRVISVGLA